jgi:hypothetical protein
MGWEEEKLHFILNLGTRWGWVVSITPRLRFTPGERTPGTHWTGGWVSPRAGLDAEARRKILCLCRGSNPGRPVCSQTLYCLSYPGSGWLLVVLHFLGPVVRLIGNPVMHWENLTDHTSVSFCFDFFNSYIAMRKTCLRGMAVRGCPGCSTHSSKVAQLTGLLHTIIMLHSANQVRNSVHMQVIFIIIIVSIFCPPQIRLFRCHGHLSHGLPMFLHPFVL